RPRVTNRALTRIEMGALVEGPRPVGLETAVVAEWDFGADIGSERVTDRSPNRLHGETVNLPARAMTGYNWTGAEMDWKKAPEQFGAIHFHEDDLDDARWETDFTLAIPAGLRSGVYAARLRGGGVTTHVSFFVRPPRGAATGRPPVAYLAST